MHRSTHISALEFVKHHVTVIYFNAAFTQCKILRLYKNAASFCKKIFNLDRLISNRNLVTPILSTCQTYIPSASSIWITNHRNWKTLRTTIKSELTSSAMSLQQHKLSAFRVWRTKDRHRVGNEKIATHFIQPIKSGRSYEMVLLKIPTHSWWGKMPFVSLEH